MNTKVQPYTDPGQVLATALLNAGKQLDFTQADLGEIIGKDRSAISRGYLDPESKSGELALLFIRAYRALYVLMGGNTAQMKHWMNTLNHHTLGIPKTQAKSIQGLVALVEYLDAMRGKV